MRILVGWDDVEEADLIAMYLGVGEHEVQVTTDHQEMFDRTQDGESWDAVLMTTTSTNGHEPDHAFQIFRQIRKTLPDTVVVGACRMDEVFRIAQFMTGGLRQYIPRDKAGDYMFLLQSTIEGAVAAVKAEREQLVAERLREEVESVRKLQRSIIPQDITSPPGYAVSARYESSQIRVLGGQPVTLAGGDYYDVFQMDDDRLVILVGDASGHGMKACMSIMTMHTLVSMIRTRKYQDTAAFVADVNRRLCQQTVVQDEGGFITLLYAILDCRTHELQWTSAGHPIPLLHRMEQDDVISLGTLDDGGMPLGILDVAEYDMHSTILPPCSRLLVYTDGLEEAFPDMTREHAGFGIDGIRKSLRDSRSKDIHESLQALFDDSSAHTQGSGRHDDTSVVLLERLA